MKIGHKKSRFYGILEPLEKDTLVSIQRMIMIKNVLGGKIEKKVSVEYPCSQNLLGFGKNL